MGVIDVTALAKLQARGGKVIDNAVYGAGEKKSKYVGGGIIRDIHIEAWQEGDVFQIPAIADPVYEDVIRGSFTTDAEGNKVQQTYSYNVVDVYNNGVKRTMNLTPGMFTKIRFDMSGTPHRPSGEVVDEVQKHVLIDDFYAAHAGKWVKLTGVNQKFDSPRFNAAPGVRPQKAWVPTLVWATDPNA